MGTPNNTNTPKTGINNPKIINTPNTIKDIQDLLSFHPWLDLENDPCFNSFIENIKREDTFEMTVQKTLKAIEEHKEAYNTIKTLESFKTLCKNASDISEYIKTVSWFISCSYEHSYRDFLKIENEKAFLNVCSSANPEAKEIISFFIKPANIFKISQLLENKPFLTACKTGSINTIKKYFNFYFKESWELN